MSSSVMAISEHDLCKMRKKGWMNKVSSFLVTRLRNLWTTCVKLYCILNAPYVSIEERSFSTFMAGSQQKVVKMLSLTSPYMPVCVCPSVIMSSPPHRF